MPMSGIATTRTLREITARPVIAINRPQRPILVAVDDHRLRKNLSTFWKPKDTEPSPRPMRMRVSRRSFAASPVYC